MGLFSKARDVADAAKTFVADQRRDFRETPGRSTAALRKLEKTDQRRTERG